jgi:nicotinamidase-related amidase
MIQLLRYWVLALSMVPLSHLSGQKTALLLIDIQDFYFPGGKVVLENPELAGMNAGLILEQFRNKGMPVYHVRHNFEPGGEIHEYVRPVPGEKVFSKDQVNAFLGTDLLSEMRADSITAIVFCGMQTHMCVEAAVRAAHDEGFTCILVGDACTTRALQYEEYIIPAKNVHYATLQTLQDTYAKVVTSGQLLKEFDQLIEH